MGKLFGGGGDEAKEARKQAEREQQQQAIDLKNKAELEAANIQDKVADVDTGGTDTPDTILADMQRRKRVIKNSASITDTASQLGVG
jgi:hypothetical protein